MTVNGMPYLYNKTCDITLNDPNVHIVIRNALILMIAFLYPNKLEAARTITQLWYCAAAVAKTWQKMTGELRPFVERAYRRSGKRKAAAQVSQRWTKNEASLRLTLTRRQWKLMLDLLADADGIDFDAAMRSRRAAVLADPRQEARRNRTLCGMPAAYRRAHVRYLNTGLLLPFGQPVSAFDAPNP